MIGLVMMKFNLLRRRIALTAVSTFIVGAHSQAYAKITGEDDETSSFYHTTLNDKITSRSEFLMNKTAKKETTLDELADSASLPVVDSSLIGQLGHKNKKNKQELDLDNSAEPTSRSKSVDAKSSQRIQSTASIVNVSMSDGSFHSFGPLSNEPSVLDRWFDAGFKAVKQLF